MANCDKHFHEQVQSPCVKIVVGQGPDMRTFFIHRSLLEANSEFFRACMNGNFAESNGDGEVQMPEDDPAAFKHVVEWLYDKTFTIDCFSEATDILKLYMMADKLMSKTLKNIVVDILQKFHERAFTEFQALQVLIEGGLSDSKAMDYLIAQAGYDLAKTIGEFWAVNDFSDFYKLGPAVMENIMQGAHEYYTGEIVEGEPAGLQGCRYHEHTEEEEISCGAEDVK